MNQASSQAENFDSGFLWKLWLKEDKMAATKQAAIEKAKENFIDDLYRICDWLRHECSDLKSGAFEDEYDFLRRKAFVLMGLLNQLPLGYGHCPFCVENLIGITDTKEIDTECKKCEYGSTHEICNSRNSVYMILSNSLKLVRRVLFTLYTDKEITQDDIASIRKLVEEISSQLEYWEYRRLLTKKGKDWCDVLKSKG